ADMGTYLSMAGESASSADPTEGIFKIDRVSSDGAHSQFGVASAGYPTQVGSAPYMEMGRSLYNELDKLEPSQQVQPYNSDRKEARYLVSVLSSSIVAPNYASLSQEAYRNQDVLYIGKYTGISN